jgi:hypothetical protein
MERKFEKDLNGRKKGRNREKLVAMEQPSFKGA